MKRDEIIAVLRAHEPELRNRGVRRAALFGSVARNEATSASDIDILIELEPEARIGVFGYVGIIHYISDIFPMPVDVANKSTLKPHVRPGAERDALYAF
jgi:predicted nucleotidyltransferase